MSGPSDSKSGSPGLDEFADPIDDESYSDQIEEDVNNSGDAFAEYQIEHTSNKNTVNIDF